MSPLGTHWAREICVSWCDAGNKKGKRKKPYSLIYPNLLWGHLYSFAYLFLYRCLLAQAFFFFPAMTLVKSELLKKKKINKKTIWRLEPHLVALGGRWRFLSIDLRPHAATWKGKCKTANVQNVKLLAEEARHSRVHWVRFKGPAAWSGTFLFVFGRTKSICISGLCCYSDKDTR